MTFEEYKHLPGINASLIKACSFGAYHGWKYLNCPPVETDAMAFGSAVHTALLEPDSLLQRFAFSPKFDRRTKEGKANAELFSARHQDKTVLTEEELSRINLIVQRCHEISSISKALETFEKEKVYSWEDAKARLDLVDEKNGVIIDIKTTRDASEREFTKQMLALRYDCQFLHYSNAIGIAATCYSITIESDTCEVALYDCTEIVHSTFTQARYERALEVARQVIEMKECPPKYKSEIINLKLPEWAQMEAVI